MTSDSLLILMIVALSVTFDYVGAWGSSDDRVMLKDISVLTLYHGRKTNARRSGAIPQLKCMGGSAGCNSFVPQVVQCYNRGSDGYDVQWECKTDMDNAYRFGTVEVSCEGYDYPDDVYVLKGSCGLEYTLDLTKEGHAQKNQGHHHEYYGSDNSYHGNSHHDYGSSYTKSHKKGSSIFGDLITVAIIAVVIYAIYKTCLSNSGHESMDDRRPAGDRPRPSAPPPPGFRDDYMPGSGCSSSYSTPHSTTYGTHTPGATGSTGGFWTGAATGGMLGYLFGSRTNTNYGYQRRPYGYGGNSWGTGWGSGWGSSSWGTGRSSGWGGGSTGSGFRSSMPSSSGTRTASGFGGTKRR